MLQPISPPSMRATPATPDVDVFLHYFLEDRHPVAGLAGVCSREQTTGLLAQGPGVIASLSRAITKASAQHSYEELETWLKRGRLPS